MQAPPSLLKASPVSSRVVAFGSRSRSPKYFGVGARVSSGDPQNFESIMAMMNESQFPEQGFSDDDTSDVERGGGDRTKEVKKDKHMRYPPLPVDIRVGRETPEPVRPATPTSVAMTLAPAPTPIARTPAPTLTATSHVPTESPETTVAVLAPPTTAPDTAATPTGTYRTKEVKKDKHMRYPPLPVDIRVGRETPEPVRPATPTSVAMTLAPAPTPIARTPAPTLTATSHVPTESPETTVAVLAPPTTAPDTAATPTGTYYWYSPIECASCQRGRTRTKDRLVMDINADVACVGVQDS
ncbi:hypothetical protein HPB50_013502 [Hyalomma asiaticum]|uniref:Uncharacterized protein n=1 Tax=Hyalomma asiaticum TaxID=266040 RepID=A0ACB7SHJ8_HYAAI|nr:hypothetical protein HPB50_013502 [Hyalomma asiaticum]